MADAPKPPQKKPRRINGFQRPWHYLQVATWFLFALIIVFYFAFLMQIMWDHYGLQVFLTVMFCFFTICASVSVYFVCSTDPADNSLISDPAKRSPVQQSDQSLYCYNCEVQVHNSSKHCRYCDKCIERFDHHCKWLNTCVGRKNYKYFLSIIVSVGFMLTEVLSIAIAVMVESFAYPHMFKHRLDHSDFNYNVHISTKACGGILLGCIVLLLGLLALVLQLAGFHAVLLYRGITTYEFIVQEQKRQRELEAAKVKARKGGKTVDERLAAAAAAMRAESGGDDIEMQRQSSGEGEEAAAAPHSRTSLSSVTMVEKDRDEQEGDLSSDGPKRQYLYEPVNNGNSKEDS